MSRKKNAAADALAREAAEAEQRMAVFEFDQRMERHAELDWQANREFLLAAKQELARDRLEAEATSLATYREQAIAAAVANKTLAPQVAAMIPAGLTSREDIDATVQLGIDKTAEIVAELAGQRTSLPVQQPRNERGQFIPEGDEYLPAGMTAEEYAKAQNKSLSMQDYTRMRDRLGHVRRDAGIFG